jgi:membrane protein
MAAALAYYAVFSIAPILIIIISIAGFFFGEQAVQGEIVDQIQGIIGADAAQIIQSALQNISSTGSGTLAATISIVTLVWAASNLFGQLQLALNTIWHVRPEETRGVLAFLSRRALAILMVVALAVFLLISLVTVTIISALSEFLVDIVPGLVAGLPLIDLGVSLLLMTLVFAVVYRVLPNVSLTMGNVLPGAALTAVLFAAGKYLIGLYLRNASYQSTYGAAGSLVVLLVWVYYSAQILLFGAEFTKIYTRRQRARLAGRKKTSAVETVAAATGEAAWPTLARAASQVNHRNNGRTEPNDSRWVWPAALAFLAGMVVGAKRRAGGARPASHPSR